MIICLDFILELSSGFESQLSQSLTFNLSGLCFLLVVQGSNLNIILIHLIRILAFMGQSLGEHRF
jgi:hypothetical protein